MTTPSDAAALDAAYSAIAAGRSITPEQGRLVREDRKRRAAEQARERREAQQQRREEALADPRRPTAPPPPAPSAAARPTYARRPGSGPPRRLSMEEATAMSQRRVYRGVQLVPRSEAAGENQLLGPREYARLKYRQEGEVYQPPAGGFMTRQFVDMVDRELLFEMMASALAYQTGKVWTQPTTDYGRPERMGPLVPFTETEEAANRARHAAIVQRGWRARHEAELQARVTALPIAMRPVIGNLAELQGRMQLLSDLAVAETAVFRREQDQRRGFTEGGATVYHWPESREERRETRMTQKEAVRRLEFRTSGLTMEEAERIVTAFPPGDRPRWLKRAQETIELNRRNERQQVVSHMANVTLGTATGVHTLASSFTGEQLEDMAIEAERLAQQRAAAPAVDTELLAEQRMAMREEAAQDAVDFGYDVYGESPFDEDIYLGDEEVDAIDFLDEAYTQAEEEMNGWI